ncbi:FUSC family protein [uncultured Phycicoccus sp.]|uniref:FUSC family protein n=1 Tax=uncultured Phycicoccus sp. TaxID=661422 RepID=UPI002621E8FF|nr:FUSC family protein [uncultured Phycicoccus sp.]
MARVEPDTGRRGVHATLRGWSQSAQAAVRSPGPERTDALLLVKAAVAAVIAWQLAVRVLDSPAPFYAPLAALLVVDRTIVRSLWLSVERVVAVIVGMSMAWVVGTFVGVTWWSMVLVMLVAMLIGRWDRLGGHGIQVPTMVLLSLLTFQWDDVDFTYLTLVETVVGGAVGVAVNAVVLAPMHLTAPRRAVVELTERVRGLLEDMAAGLREGWDAGQARDWHDRATRIAEAVPDVLDAVRTGRESTRFNLRHRLRPARIDWDGYERAVETVRRMQWPVAGLARTLSDAADDAEHLPAPSPDWLTRYAQVLEHVGEAGSRFGVHREDAEREIVEHLDAATAVLDELADHVRRTPPEDPEAWPAYGALLVEARRLVGELRADHAHASVPTDSGPLRSPLAEAVPVVRQLQEQIPVARERLQPVVPPPGGADAPDADREASPDKP